jgi:hypothetical protein
MKGRAFLDLARELVAGPTEVHWRGAAGRAYYALMLEGRDALIGWGFSPPGGQAVHAWIRLRFTYAADKDLKQIGDALDLLVQVRNHADYKLAPSTAFASPSRAQDAIRVATKALALLDAVQADAARRAAAVATIPP